MIEDEVLGQRLVDGLDDYFMKNRRKLDFVYRLSLFAYPDEQIIKIKFRLYEYPQGYKYDIEENFKSLAYEYLSNKVPNWSVQISID